MSNSQQFNYGVSKIAQDIKKNGIQGTPKPGLFG